MVLAYTSFTIYKCTIIVYSSIYSILYNIHIYRLIMINQKEYTTVLQSWTSTSQEVS